MRKIIISALAVLSPLYFTQDAAAFPFIKRAPAAKADVAPAQNPAPTNANTRTPMTPEIQMPGSAAAAEKAPDPVKLSPPATPQERLAAKSRDSLSQATFWLAELQKNPKDEECAYEASKNLKLIGSVDRAIEIAAIGLQANENSGKLWSSLGLGLLANRQNNEAVMALTKAVALGVSDTTIYNGLGIAYDSLNRFDLAAKAYSDGLKLNPNDSSILSNLGLSYALAGNLPLAEATLRRASNAYDAPIQARQNLAVIIGLQGRLAEAEVIASQDLPPEAARANIAYIREMIGSENNGGRWNQSSQNPQTKTHASN
jgi:Flp pilus assembly protein TadD